MKKSIKEKAESRKFEEFYNSRQVKNIIRDNNTKKKAGKLITLVCGVAFGITTLVGGLSYANSNKHPWPILLPVAGMGLCYGASNRMDRYYKRKTKEEIENLKPYFGLKSLKNPDRRG